MSSKQTVQPMNDIELNDIELRKLAAQYRRANRQLDAASKSLEATQADIANPPHGTAVHIVETWRNNIELYKSTIAASERDLEAIESILERHNVDREAFEQLATRTRELAARG